MLIRSLEALGKLDNPVPPKHFGLARNTQPQEIESVGGDQARVKNIYDFGESPVGLKLGGIVSIPSEIAKVLKAVLGLATNKHVDSEFRSLRCLLDQRVTELNRRLTGILREQIEQRALLQRILAAVEPLPAVKFVFTVDLEGQITEGAQSITMTNSQKATATITPIDAKGQPASVDGVPVWASSDATILTVTAAADGLSAEVAAVGPLGTAKVSVTGDADLGADVKPIFGELDVTVTQGQAIGFKIDLGTPVEQ